MRIAKFEKREFRSAELVFRNSQFAFTSALLFRYNAPHFKPQLGQLQADDYAPSNSSESSSGPPG